MCGLSQVYQGTLVLTDLHTCDKLIITAQRKRFRNGKCHVSLVLALERAWK